MRLQVGGGRGLWEAQLSQGQYQAQLGPRIKVPMAINTNHKPTPKRKTVLAKGRSLTE